MTQPYLSNDKFLAPALPAVCAPRTNLLQLFDEAAKKRILYVAAPSGFGKTTAVRLWLEQSKRETLWISLDEYDNALAIFFSLLGKRLLTTQPDNQAMTALLNDPAFRSSPVAHTIELIQCLQPDTRNYVLVLDDFHFITDRKIRQAFFAVQKRMPESFLTVLITHESVSPVEFQQNGGSDKCVQLSAKELAFSTHEIQHYFKAHNHPVKQEEAAEIRETTQGWAISIHALATAGVTTVKASSQQLFRDYFVQEIWSLLEDSVQDFLLRTAIVTKVTPELAERLTGNSKSQELLDQLCTENFFVTRYSQQQYRYHPLFVHFLQEQLAEKPLPFVEELYQIAAEYYLAENEVFLARGYALKSGSQETILKTNHSLFKSNESTTNISVEEFVNIFCSFSKQMLFAEKVFPYPYLYSQFVGYYFLVGDAAMTEYCLDSLYENLPVIRSSYPQFLADSMLITFLDYRKSLREIAAQYMKTPAFSKFKDRLEWSTLTMQLPFIHRSSRDFCDLGKFSSIRLPAALVYLVLGDRGACMLLLTQAGILYEKNQLKKARILVEKALSLNDSADRDEEAAFGCYLHASAVYAALKEEQEFSSVQQSAKEFVKASNNPTFQRNNQAFLVRQHLLDGQQEAAKDWLSHMRSDTDQLELYRIYQHFTTARALLVLNNTQEAKDFIQRLKNLAEQFHRPTDVAEAKVLLAILEWHSKHQLVAVRLLAEAIYAMQPYGYLRVISEEGRAVLPILTRLADSLEANPEYSRLNRDFLQQVRNLAEEIAKDRKGVAHHLRLPTVKLSKQQLRMLKLVASGHKNSEIAQMTDLTIHTVKFHLSAAYRKLGVTNADDAVRVGRERGLL